jgi:hypothetical protein
LATRDESHEAVASVDENKYSLGEWIHYSAV